jgi:hypothetical protein
VSNALAKARSQPSLTALGRFVDGLLQTFEDRRPGLSDSTIQEGEDAVVRFFALIFEQELGRLAETIKLQEPHLTAEARAAFQSEIEQLIRSVVIPAYARGALRFTPKERNDFYLSEERLHGAERAGWAIGGMILGYLVIWAPFIPIWSQEAVLPFVVAGLLFPNLRRYFQLRRYESELNRLVAHTDREMSRIDVHYLTSGEVMAELEELEKKPELEAAAPHVAPRETEKEP